MSTVADVIARAIDLLERVNALIDSTRAIDLPGVAAELGAAGTAAALTEDLADVLRNIHEKLGFVTALSQLGALFGLVEPLIGGLRGLFADAGHHVAELGLQSALMVGDAIALGFRRLQDAVVLGSTLMLAPEQVTELRSSTDEVIGALDALADDFRAAEAGG